MNNNASHGKNYIPSFYEMNNSKGANFTEEMPPKLEKFFAVCHTDKNECYKLFFNLHILELTGLIISLVTITLALLLFCFSRKLRNYRTRIHINLFIASLLHIVFRICKDILFSGDMTTDQLAHQWFFKGNIILMEFSRTAVFMWKFIEGLYLHNIVIVAVFQSHSSLLCYYISGWVIPAIVTLTWTMCMIMSGTSTVEWKIYSLLDLYWILEGFRCTLIIANCVFLLNILRLLVLKLNDYHYNEIVQLRKTVRAAIFLAPLFGIPSLLFLFPQLDQLWKFKLWSYITYFFVRFEGFFIALLYCFLNEEVKTYLRKSSLFKVICKKYVWSPASNHTEITSQTREQSLEQPKKSSAILFMTTFRFTNR